MEEILKKLKMQLKFNGCEVAAKNVILMDYSSRGHAETILFGDGDPDDFESVWMDGSQLTYTTEQGTNMAGTVDEIAGFIKAIKASKDHQRQKSLYRGGALS